MLFWQLFSSYVHVKKAAETMLVRKIRMYNVDEIDCSSQTLVLKEGEDKKIPPLAFIGGKHRQKNCPFASSLSRRCRVVVV